MSGEKDIVISTIKNGKLRKIAAIADGSFYNGKGGNKRIDQDIEREKIGEILQSLLDGKPVQDNKNNDIKMNITKKDIRDAKKYFGLELSTDKFDYNGNVENDGGVMSGQVVAQGLNGYTSDEEYDDIVLNIGRTDSKNVDQIFREFYEYDGFWSRSSLLSKLGMTAAACSGVYGLYAGATGATATAATGLLAKAAGWLGGKLGLYSLASFAGFSLTGLLSGKGGLLTAMASESSGGKIQNQHAVKLMDEILEMAEDNGLDKEADYAIIVSARNKYASKSPEGEFSIGFWSLDRWMGTDCLQKADEAIERLLKKIPDSRTQEWVDEAEVEEEPTDTAASKKEEAPVVQNTQVAVTTVEPTDSIEENDLDESFDYDEL